MHSTNLGLPLAIIAALTMGCAGQIAQTQMADTADTALDAQRYTTALDQAFASYETDIEGALQLAYESDAEAEAVARAHSPTLFDRYLEENLALHGLSIDSFSRFASEHPEFAASLQRLHEGRMAQLTEAAERIALQAELVELYDEIPGLEEEELDWPYEEPETTESEPVTTAAYIPNN